MSKLNIPGLKDVFYRLKLKKEKKDTFRYYLSIDSLPLWNFARILETNDLRYLIITDYYDILPELDVPQNYWDNIMIQYFEVSDNQRSKSYVNDLYAVVNLRKMYLQLNNALFVLTQVKDLEMALIVEKIIRLSNNSFRFHVDDRYFNSIAEAERQMLGLKSRIELKTKEFDRKYAQKEIKFDLYRIVDNVERFRKIPFDSTKVTVRQFLAIYKNIKEENVKAKHTGTRRNN